MANIRLGIAGGPKPPQVKLPAMPGSKPVMPHIAAAPGLHSYLGKFAAPETMSAGHMKIPHIPV